MMVTLIPSHVYHSRHVPLATWTQDIPVILSFNIGITQQYHIWRKKLQLVIATIMRRMRLVSRQACIILLGGS